MVDIRRQLYLSGYLEEVFQNIYSLIGERYGTASSQAANVDLVLGGPYHFIGSRFSEILCDARLAVLEAMVRK